MRVQKRYLHPPEKMKVVHLSDYQEYDSKLKKLVGEVITIRFYWVPYKYNFFIFGDVKDYRNRIFLYEYNFRKESKYKKIIEKKKR